MSKVYFRSFSLMKRQQSKLWGAERELQFQCFALYCSSTCKSDLEFQTAA